MKVEWQFRLVLTRFRSDAENGIVHRMVFTHSEIRFRILTTNAESRSPCGTIRNVPLGRTSE